jgi:triosephosphate isomerase
MASRETGKLWVGTSWKMNKTLAEADSFIDQLLTFPIPNGLQPFVLPPHTALARVRDRLSPDSPVLGALWRPERPLGARGRMDR